MSAPGTSASVISLGRYRVINPRAKQRCGNNMRPCPIFNILPILPAGRSMLMAAALASGVRRGPGLTCAPLRVPWPVSWPDISHAPNAVLADTSYGKWAQSCILLFDAALSAVVYPPVPVRQ
jgi:hypothetical protein